MKITFRHTASRPGFTIVELVVVITVIVLLATIGALLLSTVQKTTRDSHRSSTAKTIVEAAEAYYEKNGEYPYGADMNPTYQQKHLSSYSDVYAILPSLKSVDFEQADYDFLPVACATSSCNGDTTDALRSRFTYYSAKQGASSAYIRYAEWGCELTTSDSDPTFFLAWQQEKDNKWIFLKGRHGTATIKSFSAGPSSPTTCQFTSTASLG